LPLVTVPTESAIRVSRPEGSTVTFINQSAVNVYMDYEAGRLNSSTPLVEPMNGTKLAANGGEKEFKNFPRGGVWLRAAAYTSIEVQG
jgi:hypothetical protein